MADLIVRDIEEGTDGVRAGIIGEIGCDRVITAVEERSFRAAARAHRRTGLTITTHAARWPVGNAQLDLLTEEGVDPARVVIGHCDMVPDHDYHLALARRGAWVQFDTVQGVHEWDTPQRLDWLRSLADHGFLDRVLLSQDVCLRSDYVAMGGSGYAYVVTAFADRLKDAGFDEPTSAGCWSTTPGACSRASSRGGAPVLRQCREQQVVREGVGGAAARGHRRRGEHRVEDRLLGGLDDRVEERVHRLVRQRAHVCDHRGVGVEPGHAAVAGREGDEEVAAGVLADPARASDAERRPLARAGGTAAAATARRSPPRR